MRSIITGISVAVLMAASGFAETIITAEDYAVDSDVVLESAVREVKSIPQDTVNVIGDVVKFAKDEAVTAAEGVASVFEDDPHADAQVEGELEVEDSWDADNNIHFRSYKVSSRIGDLLQAYAADKSAPAIDVAEFFSGIEFSERTSVNYLPEFRSLFVRQTMPNLLAIEEILAGYQNVKKDLMGRQVEIEAKFIEVGQKTLEELGFDWTFNSKDGGDLRVLDNFYLDAGQKLLSDGLRTTAAAFGGGPAAGVLEISKSTGSLQWDLVINALQQSDDSDVLSAPRVVTHSREAAVIQVGERQMLPKSFEVDTGNTSPFVQHGDWELELMGVQMEVTPEIRHDGLIDLEINSKILDLLGFDPYQIVPAYSAPLLGGQHEAASQYGMNEVSASLPYVRVRKLDTRATVADGNTIGMGGLIYDKLETFRDKVPVLGSIPLLGRLFRSEGERSVKRNLMIFVTATQVDLDGRRAADLSMKK